MLTKELNVLWLQRQILHTTLAINYHIYKMKKNDKYF